MEHSVEKRALYTLLRSSQPKNRNGSPSSWETDDYRAFSLEELFKRLKQNHCSLNRADFLAYAETCDSPEALAHLLMGDQELSSEEEDRLYLLLFELWRRLMPEHPSLSILGEELDHQIARFDAGDSGAVEGVMQILERVVQVLDDNIDEGIPPGVAFQEFERYSANDLEVFVYDFASELIEEGDRAYAQDLAEQFEELLAHRPWFLLLKLRLMEDSRGVALEKAAQELLGHDFSDAGAAFYIEFLSLVAQLEIDSLFCPIFEAAVRLVQSPEEREDLQEIVHTYLPRLSLSEAQKKQVSASL